MPKVKELLEKFDHYVIENVPREKNAHANILAKLESSREAQQMEVVPIETLTRPSIEEIDCIMEVEEKPSWITPFKEYLVNGVLPKHRKEAHSSLSYVG